jgi:predicted nuclease of predicted toxin-antitoxin system
VFGKHRTRFLVDEDVNYEVVEYLRDSGWNAESVLDVGLQGHPDENVLAYAWKHDRVLLTHDDGFLDDQKHPPTRNPGVVILPGGSGDTQALIASVRIVHHLVGRYRELWRGAKIVINGDYSFSVTDFSADEGRRTTSRYRMSPRGPAEIWA